MVIEDNSPLSALSELREQLRKVIGSELVRLDAERSFLEIVLSSTTDEGVSNSIVSADIIDRVDNLIGIDRETS